MCIRDRLVAGLDVIEDFLPQDEEAAVDQQFAVGERADAGLSLIHI